MVIKNTEIALLKAEEYLILKEANLRNLPAMTDFEEAGKEDVKEAVKYEIDTGENRVKLLIVEMIQEA